MRRPLLAVLATGAILVCSVKAADDENRIKSQGLARATIDKAIKAHGGEAKLAKSQRMFVRLRCTVVLNQGEAPYYLDALWELPSKYRSVMSFGYESVVVTRTIVINGDEGWMTITTNAGTPAGEVVTKSRVLQPKEMAEAKEQMHVENVLKLLALKEAGYELAALDDIKIKDRTIAGVNVVKKGQRELNLYFDKTTGLLVQMEHQITDTTNGKDYSQRVVFAGYQDTNKGPKQWGAAIGFNDNKRIFEAEVEKIHYLDKSDPRMFAKPADLKTSPGATTTKSPATGK